MIFFSPFPVLERIALAGGLASARTPQIRTCAGGIGVRAARAARASGNVPVMVAGFQGGRMGILLGERFDEEGIEYHLVKTATQTRGSILTIDKERGGVSEILDAPQIATADEWANLFDSVAELLVESQLLVVCGHDEFGTEAGFVPFLDAAATCGLPIVGDVTGAAWNVLVARPTLFLRVDLPVLQRATETSLQHDSAIVAHVRTIIGEGEGVRNVCVSLGDDGVLLVSRNEAWRVRAPVVSRYKPVGMADALTGAFAARYSETGDVLESVAYGCAFAATSVAHDIPAESTDGEARIVRREVTVEPVLIR